MKLIDHNDSHEPSINLAIEEYLLRHYECNEEILFLYINKPSVIIGKNQNILEEVNFDLLKFKKTPVYRRISGGGTVFHDFGNLNYCYISPFVIEKINNFQEFTKPILDVLQSFNIPSKLNERHDIVIDDKKISGNAQFTNRRKILSHGTILFNADLENLSIALRKNELLIESKSIKSKRSKVTNVFPYLRTPMSIEGFRQLVIKKIFKGASKISTIQFSEKDWEKIYELQAKFKTNEWTYFRSPKCKIFKPVTINKQKFTLEIHIEKYIIQKIFLQGNEYKELDDWLANFKGVNYLYDEIKNTLDEFSGNSVKHNHSNEDWANIIH